MNAELMLELRGGIDGKKELVGVATRVLLCLFWCLDGENVIRVEATMRGASNGRPVVSHIFSD